MRTPIDDTLRGEARQYRFRFGCEHCAYFDEQTGGCSEGYPNAAHINVDLPKADSLEFCKRFELG